MGPLFLDSPPTLAYLCCSAQLARIMSQLACGGGRGTHPATFFFRSDSQTELLEDVGEGAM